MRTNLPFAPWQNHGKLAISLTTILLLTSPLQAQWIDSGTEVCHAVADQVWPAITGDGFGGTIIAWADDRLNWGNALVQRFESGNDRHTKRMVLLK